ncbi:MAG TPA: methyltransferase domain-containing protein [Burkholderiales bacterium]|nr:methyltransferase domain-containing protein [Burkholderiales bacterium]
MTAKALYSTFGANPAENYQRFFVPQIGAPVAADLLEAARLQPGERVLDVACGTGVVTRLAAERVGASGAVAGLDVNPAMLAVARRESPGVRWYEASAESMPLPDASFDVVLCQMGLQFVADKLAALREIRRVLAPGGRALISVPGPTPTLFDIMSQALAREIGPEAAGFVRVVFSLHDAGELEGLLREAGFSRAEARSAPKALRVSAPREFLWEYIHSTPLVPAVMGAAEAKRAALESEIVSRWQPFAADGGMRFEVGMTTSIAT